MSCWRLSPREAGFDGKQRLDEATLLRVAYGYEQATDWHERWPSFEPESEEF